MDLITRDPGAAPARPESIYPAPFSPPDPLKGGEGGSEGGAVAPAPPLPPFEAPAGENASRSGGAASPPPPPSGGPPSEYVEASPGSGGGALGASTTVPTSPRLAASDSGDEVSEGDLRDSSDVYTPAPHENVVVAAFRVDGMYRQLVAPGVHQVVCPWSHQHQGQGELLATYAEPDATHPVGTITCAYRHEGKLRMDQLFDHLGVDPHLARGKDIIRVIPGEMNRIGAAAERALAKHGDLYVSGNQIARIRQDPDTGDLSTEPLTEASLAKALSAAATWLKFDGRSAKFVPTDPVTRHVQLLYKGQQFEHLPRLHGLARQPYLREDGSLMVQAGYNCATRMFGAFEPKAFPLPEPIELAARNALAELKTLLAEFRFRSDQDRTTAIAAMLTATIRSVLPVAPAFNISASAPGSGKSYLASLITLFAGPGGSMNVAYPAKAEEAGKVILSLLMQRPAVILFDDMQTDWLPHGVINSMLTSATISDRLLGGNKTATVATSSLIMGTGNNVQPQRDMRRRVVSLYLSPIEDSPATISYEGRPVEVVRKARGKYVAHALTIVRAWLAAGKPITKVRDIASFEAWSELCRQPLLWLGEPDPAGSIIAQVESDPDMEAFGVMLRAWHEEFGKRSTMLRTVLAIAERNADGDLYQSFHELPFMKANGVDRNLFGWFLKKHLNRVVAGLQLVDGSCSARKAWAVVPAGEQPSGQQEHPKANSAWQKTATKTVTLKPAKPEDPMDSEIF